MILRSIQEAIDEASQNIGTTWPLYSFVTSNPLAGQEHLPFEEAVLQTGELRSARSFPRPAFYRQAWDQGEIRKEFVDELLLENGISLKAEESLQRLESAQTSEFKNPDHQVDRILVKWLSAFMDEGLAEWQMPNKDLGFYAAWRALAAYDSDMGSIKTKDIPKSSSEALLSVLQDQNPEQYLVIFKHHLTALPGWVGYIKHRSQINTTWHLAFPITVEDYLAVRLLIAKSLGLDIMPPAKVKRENGPNSRLAYLWLQAWERSWQKKLLKTLKEQDIKVGAVESKTSVPDAQMVFCIDTRSEAIRRHIEAAGNYETFGYAGFFGIAMDYCNPEDGLTRKSCPPIVASAYKVSEEPQQDKMVQVQQFYRQNERKQFWEYFLKRMKNMLPSSFGFVEGSGFFYGLYLVLRTIFPAAFYRFKEKNTNSLENAFEPKMEHQHAHNAALNLALEEKAQIVKAAFELTGWEDFAPIVIFAGHGSHSVNNPFASSLDCGACAASPGRHNARMLAKMANDLEVRAMLSKDYKISIPAQTVFIGAEHNTTTDAIVLFDDHVSSSHQAALQQIKSDLLKAQQTAVSDRLGIDRNILKKVGQKANDWGETRPEWGLARNSAFIIGPRKLTKNLNLDSRCFLNSYDWKKDEQGAALEGIMQGPVVVTQWINNHYYFSAIDNDNYGGGSKITHNITGKFGVVQGNGGDLKMGLPLQSIQATDEAFFHQPLRLSVVIQAPISRIHMILERNENVKRLFDNEWIYLLATDPTANDMYLRYSGDLKWEEMHAEPTADSGDFDIKQAVL